MRSRIVIIIVALALGGVAAIMAATYLNSARIRLDAQSQPIEVLVAQEDIQRGVPADELFAKKLVVVQKIPRQFVAADAVSSQRAVDGQVLAVSLTAGEQLTAGRFQYPSQAGLAYSVPSDYIAVSIPVDKVSSVSGLLRPGDMVAVMGTVEQDLKGAKVTATKILVSKARILAVGADSGAGAKSDSGAESAGLMNAAARDQNQAEINAVTLALSPADAEKVVFVANEGSGKGDRSLWLALLPVKATDITPTNGQTAKTALSGR